MKRKVEDEQKSQKPTRLKIVAKCDDDDNNSC